MTPKEFQLKHDLSDEELEQIRMVCKMFGGKVISITRKPIDGKQETPAPQGVHQQASPQHAGRGKQSSGSLEASKGSNTIEHLPL